MTLKSLQSDIRAELAKHGDESLVLRKGGMFIKVVGGETTNTALRPLLATLQLTPICEKNNLVIFPKKS